MKKQQLIAQLKNVYRTAECQPYKNGTGLVRLSRHQYTNDTDGDWVVIVPGQNMMRFKSFNAAVDSFNTFVCPQNAIVETKTTIRSLSMPSKTGVEELTSALVSIVKIGRKVQQCANTGDWSVNMLTKLLPDIAELVTNILNYEEMFYEFQDMDASEQAKISATLTQQLHYPNNVNTVKVVEMALKLAKTAIQVYEFYENWANMSCDYHSPTT